MLVVLGLECWNSVGRNHGLTKTVQTGQRGTLAYEARLHFAVVCMFSQILVMFLVLLTSEKEVDIYAIYKRHRNNIQNTLP